MSNIIPFGGITKLDLDPDVILEAKKGKLKGFVLVGYDKDDNEVFVSTYADGGEALWLLERGKKKLLEVPDQE